MAPGCRVGAAMSETRLDRLVRLSTDVGQFVRVVVIGAEGSTPRGTGTEMLVFAGSLEGTIGGGALEFEAVTRARRMLELAAETGTQCSSCRGADERLVRPSKMNIVSPPLSSSPGLDHWHREIASFPLGPALGQCCGGFVRVMLERWEAGETCGLGGRVGQAGSDPLPMSWYDECGRGGRKAGQVVLAARLVLTPLVSGPQPLPVVDRDQLAALPIPVGVGRSAARMLSGERPVATTLVRGSNGVPDWLIEPADDHRHQLTIYGAGHVGRAIVRVMAELPFDIGWVDTSAERFAGAQAFGATPVIANDPAAYASAAPPRGFHLVLTYSHPLDLAICHALLARNDFAFLGLIGSATKRARFIRRLADAGVAPAAIARLTSPIGIASLAGKSPAVIAIAVAAQLVEIAEQMTQARTSEQHAGTAS